MNEEERAFYMVMAHPGPAGVEHYRKIYSSYNAEITVREIGGETIYFSEEDVVEGPHPRNLHLGGTPISMTLRMVGAVVAESDPAWHVVKISPNSMEYELAGFVLVCSALDPALKEEMRIAGWFNVQLDRWVDVMKPHLDAVRRFGMFGSYVGDGVFGLRKILNVTYRRDEEADWEKEKYNRCNKSYGKVLLAGG